MAGNRKVIFIHISQLTSGISYFDTNGSTTSIMQMLHINQMHNLMRNVVCCESQALRYHGIPQELHVLDPQGDVAVAVFTP
jgi:hypothetical protein